MEPGHARPVIDHLADVGRPVVNSVWVRRERGTDSVCVVVRMHPCQ